MSLHKIFILSFTTFLLIAAKGQIKLDKDKLNYLFAPKPNSFIYHDTLYAGAKQFKKLFYSTRDIDLIYLYQLHQERKVWGNILSVTGSIGMIAGVNIATSGNNTTGWIFTGSGFLMAAAGGVLITSGKALLHVATDLFNRRIAHNTNLP